MAPINAALRDYTQYDALSTNHNHRNLFMLMIIVITVLAVLYGLAWHNEPARDREGQRRSNQ